MKTIKTKIEGNSVTMVPNILFDDPKPWAGLTMKTHLGVIYNVKVEEYMKRVERIPLVMKYMDWDLFLEGNTPEEKEKVKSNLDEIEELWKSVPTLRLGQLLINEDYIEAPLGVAPEMVYHREEVTFIIEKGLCEERDILLWGNNYDKDMNKLPKTIWKPIKELKTEHIEAILGGMFVEDNNFYRSVFINELDRRYDEQIHDD